MSNSEERIQKLSDEEVGEVAGAEIIKGSSEWHNFDAEHPWYVVDSKTGKYVGKYATKEQAKYEAEWRGYKPDKIWMKRTVDRMQRAWQKHKESGGTYGDDWENPFGK